MSTPQDTYYKTMNVMTSPFRLLIDLGKTLLIFVLLIGAGISYPVYLACNGQPVTAASMAISGLTIFALLTFIYAPYYFLFGGMFLAAAFTWGVCSHEDFMYAHNFNGWGLAWLFFGFLAFGVMQRFIRHRLFDPPKPKRDPRSPAERMFDYGDYPVVEKHSFIIHYR